MAIKMILSVCQSLSIDKDFEANRQDGSDYLHKLSKEKHRSDSQLAPLSRPTPRKDSIDNEGSICSADCNFSFCSR